MIRLLGSLAALVLGVASAQATSTSPLDGDWRLVQLTDSGRWQPVNPGHAPTLRAGAGRVSGSTGCNSYGGRLDMTGTVLKVGPLISTKMACPDDLDGLESRFLQLMDGARRFEQAGNQLTVSGTDGVLVFQKTSSLPPTPAQAVLGHWQLTGMTDATGASSVQGKTPPTLEIEAGQLDGSDGCNAFGGPLTLDGRRFQVGTLISTMRACPNVTGELQSGAYTKLLSRMTTYTVAGDTVTLYGPEGATLTFNRVTP